MNDLHSFKLTSNGFRGRLEIDGVDLSDAVRAVTVRHEVDNLPTVTVELCLFTGDVNGSEAIAHLPDETRDALIALGWTPPQD